MREILFRAKNVWGKWCEGYLVKMPNYFRISTRDDLLSFGVDAETIGQFTGLTDKNGKKIFEGDIVESEFTKKPYLVGFGEYTYTNEYGEEEGACGWYNEEKGGYLSAFAQPDAWATVIGNIHDNPELLEAK